ncbi:MAG TPA: T9SS type A sorting domain-containing protein [Bacteroidia bacterium]|nr:T9SS type A sorting domain-containing protein [Bacteroidia bacterium]
MGANSKIIIPPGITVVDTKCHFFACSDMWDGIFIYPTAALASNNDVYNDAYHAIVSVGGGLYKVTNSMFDNNYIGILDSNYTSTFHGATVNSSTFKCSGTLRNPYAGQQGYAGIVVNGVTMGIFIGQPGTSTVQNLFDGAGTSGMKFGITNDQATKMFVYNNVFQNFVNNTICLKGGCTPTGVCIWAQNRGSITIGGTIATKANTFKNSSYGIIAETNMSLVDVRHNKFTAILKPSSPAVGGGYCITVQNSTLFKNSRIVTVTDSNTFTNFNYGVYTFNYGQSSVTIDSNFFKNFTGIGIFQSAVTSVGITIIGNSIDPLIANSTKAIGIELGNPVVSNTGPTVISGNDIYRCNTGIWLMNYPNASIIDQNSTNNAGIHFTGTAPVQKTYGIRLQNGVNTTISHNDVSYGTTPTDDSLLVGISVETGCLNTQVTENLLTKMGTGIKFMNISTKPLTMTCNNMNLDRVGVTLSSANIGDQGLPPSIPNPNGVASDNVWLIPSGATSYGVKGINLITPHPAFFVRSTSAGTPLWFPPLAKIHPAFTITPGAPLVPGAAQSCSSICYSPPCAKKALIALASNQAPYSAMSPTMLFQAHQQAYAQLAVDTTLGQQPGDSILVVYRDSLKQTNIGAIHSVATSLSILDTATAQIVNSAISPNNLMEQNHKIVNSIFIRTWALGQYVMSSSDSTVLLGIAKQSVFRGGIAVYDARMMIGQFFDDPDMDVSRQEELAIAQPITDPIARSGKMFPNPSNSSFYYSTVLNSGESGFVEMYDLLGKKLQTKPLKEGENMVEFGTGGMSNGIYFYKVTINGRPEDTGKVILSK